MPSADKVPSSLLRWCLWFLITQKFRPWTLEGESWLVAKNVLFSSVSCLLWGEAASRTVPSANAATAETSTVLGAGRWCWPKLWSWWGQQRGCPGQAAWGPRGVQCTQSPWVRRKRLRDSRKEMRHLATGQGWGEGCSCQGVWWLVGQGWWKLDWRFWREMFHSLPPQWWQYAMYSCANMGVFFACSSGNRRYSRPVKRSQTSYFA